MSLLKITIKLIYNFCSSFKGSKYKMAAIVENYNEINL